MPEGEGHAGPGDDDVRAGRVPAVAVPSLRHRRGQVRLPSDGLRLRPYGIANARVRDEPSQ